MKHDAGLPTGPLDRYHWIMQEPTIALTDMQMERLAEEERRQGLPTDVLIRLAVDAFLGRNGATPSGGQIGHDEENVPEGHAGGEEPSPQLWYVGLGRSGDTDTSERSEDIIVEEWGD